MAWTAKIMNATATANGMQTTVNYYDSTDTGFTTILAVNTFTFPRDVTNPNAVAQIKATGADLRTATTLAATYVGTTINVP